MFILTSLKTEIARSARGPKVQGPRAEEAMAEPYFVQKIFGDSNTAHHKVLSEGCESRNNHRYAVVVQDVASQWIQSYPCKTKTETPRSLQKFLEPTRKPKVIYTDLEFGKACEDLSLFRLVHWLSITLSLRKTSQGSINLERKSHLDYSLDTLCTREKFGRVTYWLQTLRSWKRWTHQKSTLKDSMQRK